MPYFNQAEFLPEAVASVANLDNSCMDTAGRVMDGYFNSEIVGRRQHYYVYLPACYDVDSEARYPVIYLLHGSSDNVIPASSKFARRQYENLARWEPTHEQNEALLCVLRNLGVPC